jgi:hypothetical protein
LFSKLSTPLFLAYKQSEFIKQNHARDETKLQNWVVFKAYDVQKRYNGLGMEFGDVRDF